MRWTLVLDTSRGVDGQPTARARAILRHLKEVTKDAQLNRDRIVLMRV